MNWTLFKATTRANWVIALYVTLFIMIYVVSSISMYDPSSADTMKAMLDLLPEGLVKALGFENMGTDLTGYISNYLYGFILLTFPLIYCVIAANRMIAKHVDSGSMSYLLTTPNSRVKVATTQAVYLAVSLAAIMVADIALAILMCESMFPGMLEIGPFLALNWVTYLAMLVVSGIGFFSSCLFNETRLSLSVGAGLPILFLIFNMISGLSDKIAWLRYLTVFTFVDVDRTLSDTSYIVPVTFILLAISSALYVSAIRVFNRKSLAI